VLRGHHNKPATAHPPVYTFVTDGVVSAIEQAKNAADIADGIRRI
jgi:hypothetical protein